MFKKYQIPYELDDPRTTLAHREIISKKPFLKKWYLEQYKNMVGTVISPAKGKCLEIGSGGGFMKSVYPGIITSDIMPLDGVDMVFSAEKMPFENESLDAIFMLNVFHHIPKPYLFLNEAERALKKGGKIVMTEPANSAFARFIYKRFHHEPFDETGGREIEAGKPLSHSNQALPHIYFERDKQWFSETFPQLFISSIKYHSPFSYLLSGGVSRSALLPSAIYPVVRFTEQILSPLMRHIGLFCTIEIVKK